MKNYRVVEFKSRFSIQVEVSTVDYGGFLWLRKKISKDWKYLNQFAEPFQVYGGALSSLNKLVKPMNSFKSLDLAKEKIKEIESDRNEETIIHEINNKATE